MARDYIGELIPETEAVERWENEGGKLRQHPDWNVTSVTEDRRDNKQVIFIASLGRTNQTTDAMIHAPNKAKFIPGQERFRRALPGISLW